MRSTLCLSFAISLFTGLTLIACAAPEDGLSEEGDPGNGNGNRGESDGGSNVAKLDAGSLKPAKDGGGGVNTYDAGTPSTPGVDASKADSSPLPIPPIPPVPPVPSQDSGSNQGAGVCPVNENIQIISQGGGQCNPSANRFANGQCSSPNDCGVVCCACPGVEVEVQACVGNKCVPAQTACACANDTASSAASASRQDRGSLIPDLHSRRALRRRRRNRTPRRDSDTATRDDRAHGVTQTGSPISR